MDEAPADEIFCDAEVNSLRPDTTICVFAKPPCPGTAKTRLIPQLGAEGAALVARALLQDSLSVITSIPKMRSVIASTERFETESFGRVQLWIQPEGDLGTRLEHILRRALSQSSHAIAIGADTPGITAASISGISEELRATDAVFGPTEDGGFYLVGLKRCPEGLFQDIRWSHRNTLIDATARTARNGMSYSLTTRWFDVDTPEDLVCAARLIQSGEMVAPHLEQALRSFGILQRQPVA